MPSITSWTRLEPRARSEDMRASLQARLHDPLWLLARQWQVGEFQGEDAGSPVVAHLEGESARLTRYHPGPLAGEAAVEGQSYDSKRLPLETLVERERVLADSEQNQNLGLAIEAGLHFLRCLEAEGMGQYRMDYVERYAFEPPAGKEQPSFSHPSFSYLKVMARRAPDGLRLYADLRGLPRRPDGALSALPDEPGIVAGDADSVGQAAGRWLDWFESLFSEPAAEASSWLPERMEYEFAVSAATSEGELVLAAPEYLGGHLDWYAFNLRPGASLGATSADGEPEKLTRSVIPTAVSYRGMPAPRWWEFEDAQVNFEAVAAGPSDLSRLLFLEFTLLYSNDWFVIPIELEVGSICSIRSLVVTDSFGERTVIPHYSEKSGHRSDWRMFCPALDARAAAGGALPPQNILFLPPVLGASLHSPPVEEVLFLRDEMANMAWAVERVVESHTGAPLDRFEAFQEARQREQGQETPPEDPAAAVRYRLATRVPDYWIPLVPVQMEDKRSVRLRRGKMLQSRSDELVIPEPHGRILEPGQDLSLFEEEISRTGARAIRAYQYSRWLDGSTQLWLGRRKQPGRGEGWSGLRFDVVEAA